MKRDSGGSYILSEEEVTLIYGVLQKIKKLAEDSQLEPPKELTEK
jgi:hypothetical protein